MKTLLIIFLIIIFALSNICVAEDINYFEPLALEDMPAALEKVNANDCDEFQDRFFSPPEDFLKTMFQATAYDGGLCVEQDLLKAKNLYEKTLEESPSFMIATGRLAMIYKFGPESIRSDSKARFFAKQTVISLSALKDEKLRERGAHNLSGNQKPLPEIFITELNWLKEYFKKPLKIQRQIADKLKSEGYELGVLYNYSQDERTPTSSLSRDQIQKIYANPNSEFYDPEKAYNLYLNLYADKYLRFERNTERCVERISIFSKEFSNNYLETKALSRVSEICKMDPDQLQELVKTYEQENPENDVILKSIYYNLYYKHKQKSALYKLKDLGEPVVTEMPQKE